MIVNELLVYNKEEPRDENINLCREIACVSISATITCTVFLLWFFHEINSEYYNSTIY